MFFFWEQNNKAVYLYVIVIMYDTEKLPLKNLGLNFALFLPRLSRVYPWLRGLGYTSLTVFLMGFFLWNVDNIFCDKLRWVISLSPGSSLIAFWHKALFFLWCLFKPISWYVWHAAYKTFTSVLSRLLITKFSTQQPFNVFFNPWIVLFFKIIDISLSLPFKLRESNVTEVILSIRGLAKHAVHTWLHLNEFLSCFFHFCSCHFPGKYQNYQKPLQVKEISLAIYLSPIKTSCLSVSGRTVTLWANTPWWLLLLTWSLQA